MILVYLGVATSLAALLLVDLLNLDHPVLYPAAHMASYFVHARAGWLVTVLILAGAVAAFALLPHLRRRAAVAVFGAGLVVAGLVPTQPYGQWDDQSLATLVHGIGGWAAFVAIPVAAWRLRRDVPAWPGLVAAVLVVLLAVGTVEVMGDGPDHLGHVAGLVERLLLVAELGWLVLAARTLRRT
ncbi:DUF998 domain-containing protein [Actinophytocola sp.]|uniref:DUF998 domain-containing protein n=1 Tax=Actinophytocola sp. TaxID=1872138 RepID=UPI002ED510E1